MAASQPRAQRNAQRNARSRQQAIGDIRVRPEQRLAALRRYHELPQWRSIWRQIEIAGVPEGMFSIEQ